MGGAEVKLVDTSSWVEYLRELDSGPSERVEELMLKGEAAWCDMTLVELWNGARGAREKHELAELEKEVTLLPVNDAAWNVARQLARRCVSNDGVVPATRERVNGGAGSWYDGKHTGERWLRDGADSILRSRWSTQRVG